MKQVFKIALAELKHLFYSPLAWVGIFILFLFFAIDYINVLGHYVEIIEKGGSEVAQLKSLTSTMTLFCPGLAWFVRLLMIHSKFVVPFIMMGAISREYAAGTIRLIYSSPIKISTFIWGKFMGAVLYCLFITLVFSILIIAFCISVGSPDVGLLLWQLFATFLYYVFISAVCLFSSSLSSYAIVGGVISIIILLVMSVLNSFGQQSVLSDFFFPLSHQGVIHRLITGNIDLNDLIFLEVLTFLFVLLTIVKIQNGSRNYNVAIKTSRYLACISGAILIIAMLPYTPLKVIDITREKSSTLHPSMQKVLTDMNEGPLEVTHYINIIFPGDRASLYIPEARPAIKYNTWRQYLPYKKDIIIKFKYYYTDKTSDVFMDALIKSYKGLETAKIAAIMADTYGFDLNEVHKIEDIRKEINLPEEEYNGHLIKLKYLDRETLVRTSSGSYPNDKNLYPALERLVTNRGTEMYLIRDGKPMEMFYKGAASALTTYRLNPNSWRNTGPLMDSIRLANQNIPNTAKSMLLVGPKEELSAAAIIKIKEYIDAGGNLLIAGEPEFKEFVQPLMNYIGVKMKEEVIIQPTDNTGSNKLLGYIPEEAYPYLWKLDSIRRIYKKIHRDTLSIVLNGCSALEATPVNGFKITPLVYNDPGRSWNLTRLENYDSLSFALPKGPADEYGRFPMVLLLTRIINTREQKIIVSGDADIIRPLWFPNVELNFNFDFISSIQTILTDGTFEVNLSGKNTKDNYFKIGSEGVSIQRVAFLYILPAAILLSGVILIFKRSRK